MTDRVAPHDLEAERAVLASVLLDPEGCLDTAASILEAAHFYALAHGALWKAIRSSAKAAADLGTGFGETAVRGELERDGKLAMAGDALGSLLNEIPDTRHIELHATTVRNLYVCREVAAAAAALVNKAHSGKIGDLTEFLDEAEHVLSKVCEARPASGTLHGIKDIVVTVFEELTTRAEEKKEMVGWPSGFEDLDRYLQGMQAGLTYVVAGRPGMGKTGWALNLLRNVAEAAGKPALFFSLEMTKEQLAMRMLSSESMVDGTKMRMAKFTRDDWQKLGDGASVLCDLPIYIEDQATDLEDICRIARRKARDGELSIMMIDYLQLCSSRGHDSREQEISHISRTFKLLAKELRIPIIELSQLNRGVETRGGKDKRPMLSDLRESGAIEQDADAVIFLYRDEMYNPDSPDRGLCELILAKWRFGPTGAIKIVFRKEFTRFESYSGGYENGEDGADAGYDHAAGYK